MANDEIGEDSYSYIHSHGGYQGLYSSQKADIVYEATLRFCARFLDRREEMFDRMVQSAHACKHNLIEGFMVSKTSRKLEIQFTVLARESIGHLLIAYHDFLQSNELALWDKDSKAAKAVRRMGVGKYVSYETYQSYIEMRSRKTAANAMVCLIHQTDYLIDSQLRSLQEILATIGD